MKNKESLREVPKKNYLILAVIFIVTILFTLYINEWIKTYKNEEISKSPLSGEIKSLSLNELEEPLYEVGGAILYISYTNDRDLYSSEKKLHKAIDKKNLFNQIFYIKVDKNNNSDLSHLKKRFNTEDEKVVKAPMFIYIKDGKTEDIVTITDYKNIVKEFEKLVKKYELNESY